MAERPEAENLKKKKMEKVLIKSDGILADEKICQANEDAQEINKIILPALEDLGVDVTMETITDCVQNRGENTIACYLQMVEGDIKHFKVKVQKDKVREAADLEISRLKERLKISCKTPISFFEFNKRKGVFLSKEGEYNLIESTKTYLTDNQEIEAYQAHLSATEALNKLFKGKVPLWWYRLFQVDGNELFTPAEEVNYSVIAGTVDSAID